MNPILKLRDLVAARTPGPWRWLGHKIGGSPRIWTWTDDANALDEEKQLTNASPGDPHPLNGGHDDAILMAVSCGYGGETDILVSDEDAKFIATMGTIADELIAVVEAAKEFEENLDASINANSLKEERAWIDTARTDREILRLKLAALESRLTAIFGEAK